MRSVTREHGQQPQQTAAVLQAGLWCTRWLVPYSHALPHASAASPGSAPHASCGGRIQAPGAGIGAALQRGEQRRCAGCVFPSRAQLPVRPVDDLLCSDFAADRSGAVNPPAGGEVVRDATAGAALGAVAGATPGHGDREALGTGAGKDQTPRTGSNARRREVIRRTASGSGSTLAPSSAIRSSA